MSGKLKNSAVLAGFVLLVALIAAFGTQFTPGDWYAQLNKPVWTPPNRVFPVVWPLLYLLIAVAGWLAWCTAGWNTAKMAFVVYFLQLLLNAIWSWLFFGLQNPLLGLVDILLLLIVIAANTLLFYRIRPLAGFLLLPYFLWVLYASSLNAAIVVLN